MTNAVPGSSVLVTPPDPVIRWPVATWAAPRGERTIGGSWRWHLETRPETSYRSETERRSVAAYREMAAVLVAARDERGWSLRQLRAESAEALWMFTPAGEETRELPLSVLTGLEKGSSWPKFNTLAAAALKLAQRVQVAAPWTAATPGGDDERVDPADLELSAREDGHLPARAWQEVIMLELRNRMVACGTSQFEVAREVGLRPNTVTELSNQHPTDFRYASVRTLLAIASHLGARLEVAPADAPWPSRSQRSIT